MCVCTDCSNFLFLRDGVVIGLVINVSYPSVPYLPSLYSKVRFLNTLIKRIMAQIPRTYVITRPSLMSHCETTHIRNESYFTQCGIVTPFSNFLSYELCEVPIRLHYHIVCIVKDV